MQETDGTDEGDVGVVDGQVVGEGTEEDVFVEQNAFAEDEKVLCVCMLAQVSATEREDGGEVTRTGDDSTKLPISSVVGCPSAMRNSLTTWSSFLGTSSTLIARNSAVAAISFQG